MVEGYIKWFNNVQGFGFMVADDTKEDIFVHYKAIKMEGYKTVNAKQRVKATVVSGKKGLTAESVELL